MGTGDWGGVKQADRDCFHESSPMFIYFMYWGSLLSYDETMCYQSFVSDKNGSIIMRLAIQEDTF